MYHTSSGLSDTRGHACNLGLQDVAYESRLGSVVLVALTA